jgi:hypothetical protein
LFYFFSKRRTIKFTKLSLMIEWSISHQHVNTVYFFLILKLFRIFMFKYCNTGRILFLYKCVFISVGNFCLGKGQERQMTNRGKLLFGTRKFCRRNGEKTWRETEAENTEMHLAIRRLAVPIRARAGGKWRSGTMRLAIRWWKRRNGVWKRRRRWKIIYFYAPLQDPDDKALLELCTPPPIYKPGVWRTMNVVLSAANLIMKIRFRVYANSFCSTTREITT